MWTQKPPETVSEVMNPCIDHEVSVYILVSNIFLSFLTYKRTFPSIIGSEEKNWCWWDSNWCEHLILLGRHILTIKPSGQ